jgi:hypothetical protein
MAYLFFDDTKHPQLGFSLGAFVASKTDLVSEMQQLLLENGLVPGQDEFKSGARAEGNARQHRLREGLKFVVEMNCSVAVVVVPSGDEFALGAEALELLPSVLECIGADSRTHEAFFDMGLFRGDLAGRLRRGERSIAGCDIHIEQDSKKVLGIQVADHVAHCCSMMLHTQLGRPKKSKSFLNPSTEEPFEAPLDWEFWVRLRRRFLAQPLDVERDDLTVDTEPFGLRIAEACSTKLQAAARASFGRMYVGGIW